ncbi:MAG: hypothetical protein HOH58_06105 [Opitutaceae bacterium]|jgi:hypothetical protein|nr:hypothetical protein [Opitutaceae bacterium]
MKNILKLLISFPAVALISLHAQMGPPIPPGETFYAGEVLGVFQSSADMDAGGDMSIHRLGFKFGAIRGLDGGSSIGGGLSYTMLGYRFEGVPAQGGFKPWEDIDQLQLSLQYRYAIDGESSMFLMPSVTSSGESGASFGDGIEFGAIFGYTKTFSRELTLGIGGGAFYGLEDTSGFPVIFVYWQMADNWRLSNPFRPGPSGPAGLEVVYTGLTGWEIGFGGGYRVSRFALNDVGAAPNGFGQNEGAAMFVRASREFQTGGNLDLYVGTVVGGELELEDSGGSLLARTDYDPSILFALAFTQRW